jgi:hypothetical protein
MRADAQPLRQSGGPVVERPLTVLLIGDSKGAKLTSFKEV